MLRMSDRVPYCCDDFRSSESDMRALELLLLLTPLLPMLPLLLLLPLIMTNKEALSSTRS